MFSRTVNYVQWKYILENSSCNENSVEKELKNAAQKKFQHSNFY